MLVHHRAVKIIPGKRAPAVPHGQGQGALFAHGHAVEPNRHGESRYLCVGNGLIRYPPDQRDDFTVGEGSSIAFFPNQFSGMQHAISLAFSGVLQTRFDL